MEEKEKTTQQNESVGLTERDFNEFLTATGEEQWHILLAHAEKNKKNVTAILKEKGLDGQYAVEITDESDDE